MRWGRTSAGYRQTVWRAAGSWPVHAQKCRIMPGSMTRKHEDTKTRRRETCNWCKAPQSPGGCGSMTLATRRHGDTKLRVGKGSEWLGARAPGAPPPRSARGGPRGSARSRPRWARAPARAGTAAPALGPSRCAACTGPPIHINPSLVISWDVMGFH